MPWCPPSLADAAGVLLPPCHHGQPLSALPTAVMISLMTIFSSPLRSPAGQALIGRLSSAMFTNVMSSLMVTSSLPLQSPTHGMPAVTVAAPVAVAVAVASFSVAVAVVVAPGDGGVRGDSV